MRADTRYRFALFVLALHAGCVPDATMKIDYNDRPRPLDDGWVLSTPEAEGIDAGALELVYRDLFSEDKFVTAISLIIVRRGKIVAEGYCRDLDDVSQLNALQSATKSVTSVLTGMALRDGYIDGVEQRIVDIIPTTSMRALICSPEPW